jgi:hypothetical protein
MRLLETPCRVPTAPVKAPAHVAEEFGLEQVSRNRAAVERDKTMCPARRVVMDRARDYFLARSSFHP